MAGSVRVLVPLAILSLLGEAFGQTASTTPSPAGPQKKQPGAWLGGKIKQPFGDGTPSPEFDNVRRALDALTPEQRKRFQENFLRWANLPPEEKKALREREEMRKSFMAQEVEAAMKETGLQFEGERREMFIKRYGDERRKIEEQLRKETSEKRKPLVRDLIGRLKTEFSESSPAPVASPTPAVR